MTVDLKKRQRRWKIQQVIKALEAGYSLTQSVRVFGKLSKDCWYKWEKKWPRLERLRRAAEDKKDDVELKEVEKAFLTKLKNGKGHPIEYIFYFTNRDPIRWKDKRTIPSALALAKTEGVSAERTDRELEEDKELQRTLLGELAEVLKV